MATFDPAPLRTPPALDLRIGFLQRHSLQIAGLLNLIGDVGFFMSGLKAMRTAGGDAHQRMAGIFSGIGGGLYTLGGLNLILFGHLKEQQQANLAKKTAVFLQEKVGTLPAGTGLAAVQTQPEKTAPHHSFLYRHAAQNTLVAYTLGAAALLGSGIGEYKAGLGKTKLAYGITSLTVKLVSLLIPEKTSQDTGKEPKTVMGWVQEKPLRILGYGSVITDLLLAKKAHENFTRGHEKLWPMITAGTYILADWMIAISNKNKENVVIPYGAHEKEHAQWLAAETIAQQPPSMQPLLVKQVADFMAHQPGMRGKFDSHAAAITMQLKHMRDPNWTQKMGALSEEPAAEAAR